MERVPACAAPLVWDLSVWSYDTVANRTLGLALECALDVAAPCAQRVDEGAVEDGNRA